MMTFKTKPLSKEAQNLRKPYDVITLLSADPTPIKRNDVLRTRLGYTIRNKKS